MNLTAGSTYHVMQKAVAEAPIFSEKAAREFYLARLGKIAREEGVLVLAFALMDTHVHLTLFVPRSLERMMRRLGTAFAIYYNRRHGRKGHVFGRAFLAREIVGEDDFRRTLRYVIRNPAHARLHSTERDLRRSDRTSYPSLVGDSNLFAGDAAIALRYFGTNPVLARAELLRWLTMTNDDFELVPELREWETGAGDEASERRAVARELAVQEEENRQARIAQGWDLERIGKLVADAYGVTVDQIRAPSKVPPLPTARAVVAYLSSSELGLRLVDIAKWLGTNPSTVQRGLLRGEAAADDDVITLDGAIPPEDEELQSHD